MNIGDRSAGSRQDREGGFTLIEVLVAFMIIALTVTMALRVLAEGAAWARRGPAQSSRIEEAASVMDGLLADRHLQPGDTSGAFTDGARWRARIVDVTTLLMPQAPARLLRIEVFTDEASRTPLLVTIATGSRR
ncbi:type II secretion system protein [Lichenifustis flavocetrariae]|uniref:type II secretion system protein n=1 Tax=Lichenifustis flavocetrariae TaxID=2949735 RepID=UPI0024A6B45E|nr:type II secretion system protein [Lichenifustis flavocetrariae]